MTTTNHEQAASALRTLESLGYDVKALWRQVTEREDAHERGTPGEFDRRYEVATEPPRIAAHLSAGQPQELAPHTMWKGYHYTLSPGQRKWFREFTGMTPARTVTVSWVEVWPGTRHPRSFKVVSDVHVDPRLRRHTITEMVIRNAGEFFAKAAEFDAEEVVEKTLSLVVGPVNVWSAKHRWAVADLSGVKLQGDEVEIVYLDEEKIQFQDAGGRRAFVQRKEFLETVTDYVRLYDGGTKSPRKAASPRTMSVEELMKELEGGLPVT